MNRFVALAYITMGAVLVLVGTLLRDVWQTPPSAISVVAVAIAAIGAMLALTRNATARRRPLNVEYDQVTAKRFVIVNDKDTPLLDLSSDETGGTLEVRATDGTLRARMRVQDNGGTVRLYGPGSAPLLTVGVANNENGYLRISGVNGKARIESIVDADTGLLQVCGPDGAPRAVLRVVPDGGSLRIASNDGQTRAEVRSDATTALFHIYGEEGEARVEMGADEQGGIIGVLGQDGKPRARVRGMSGCGVIRVTDQNGRVCGDFGVDNNAGYLKLLDSEGHLVGHLPEPSKK